MTPPNPPIGPGSTPPDLSGPPPVEVGPEPRPPGQRHEGWRSPTGLSAIAALLTVVLGVVTLLVTGTFDDKPASAPTEAPASASALAVNKLFVYGSTKPGQPRYPNIAHFVESSTADSVPGYLYDSGLDYPLAKFGPGDPIPGYVLTIHAEDVEEFFTSMTQMESGLFAPVEVRTTAGLRVRAFEWIGPTDGLQRIARWDG